MGKGNAGRSVGVGGRASGWAGWCLSALGLGLATGSGVLMGHALSHGKAALALIGVVGLGYGALLVISGMRSGRRAAVQAARREYAPPRGRGSAGQERAVPLLGELLVHKYQLISERDLERALSEQKEHGGYLGQTLVRMRVLDYSQLAKVLEDQLAYGDPWRRAGDKDGKLSKEAFMSME